MATLTIKKVGNHWYCDVSHDLKVDISLSDKIEKFCNVIQNKYGTDIVSFSIEEVVFIKDSTDLICFKEEDITRYFITNDEFNLKFKINGREFEINSNLYYYITQELGLNFHISMYTIKLN